MNDYGSGGTKSSSGVLEGWSLNLLTESESGTGILDREAFKGFGLEQVNPNPVGSEAIIRFCLTLPGSATLSVYNTLGQAVAQLSREYLEAGIHERIWQPGSLPPGAYFVQLESQGMFSIRKVILE